MAQQQRDGTGLFQRRRAIEAFEAIKRDGGGGRHVGPEGRHRCRFEGLGDEPQALPRSDGLVAVPGHHVGTLHAKVGEQAPEAELGMAGVVVERLPGLGVETLVEARQHDAAGRQAGDTVQEIGTGGNAARRTGGDDRGAWRILLPGPDAGFEQPVAVGRRIAGLFGRQHAGPSLGDDSEEIQCQLPVFRQLGRHDVGQRREIEPFGLHLIDQNRQLASQPGRLGGIEAGPLTSHDQPAQQQLTPEARDRPVPGAGFVPELLALQQKLLGVDFADGLDGRQQQRLPLALTQKSLTQTTAGPPCGQQDGHLSKLQGGAVPGQHASRQYVDEGQSGGDAADVRGGPPHARPQSAARAASASARPAGEPTCIQIPRWRQPKSRRRPSAWS